MPGLRYGFIILTKNPKHTSTLTGPYPQDPWEWYIYHEWLIFTLNVGKCTMHGSHGIELRFLIIRVAP